MLHLRDMTYGLLILALIPLLHYGIDSTIYSGLWSLKYDYLPIFIIPAACIMACGLARPAPFFLTGICLAFSLTLAMSMLNDMIWPRHGHRGLDYLLGSLGASAGAIITLTYLKISKAKSISSYTLLGFTGTLLGFIISQQAFCNTVIYCGPFSLMYYTQ
ncbi:hypothetical protein LPB260_26570 [Pseudomonas sp. LPB0260]|uniref:hypothetical protein n=1 Tax=Pseudomonas sp. LPB0260 TaxID=2614442 RepID=UPI0015C21A47|nr:hypothetical protein [Pseudomonas sp. LPB0260]QLC74261.1 hypothetical protein LPB260_11620 [Pseudomonas sp. LPB0260]QLC77031.1 hypothetical protein LPB260_26570 [Pseudomonas sp. LPB0260]